MALTSEQLQGLEGLLLAQTAGANPLPQIRAEFPGLQATRCDADDMRGESPYRRSGSYNLFLVDTSNHCWKIVDDPQLAGGVVIAACG
jgi:hypothetical protein